MSKSLYAYDRKKLYEEVWKEPMIIVCKRYGLSNNGLKRVCKKMNIPVPGAGHWVKVRAGINIEKPPLPKYNGPQLSNKPQIQYTPAFENFCRESTKWKEESKFNKLKTEALDWQLANAIRDYVRAVETRVLTARIPQSEKIMIRRQLEWAKKKTDWLDPLVAAEDPLLGKNRYRRLFFDED